MQQPLPQPASESPDRQVDQTVSDSQTRSDSVMSETVSGGRSRPGSRTASCRMESDLGSRPVGPDTGRIVMPVVIPTRLGVHLSR